MSAIERMTITIPSEMAATVREAVAGGEYASTSEVIRDALRAWVRVHDEERRELAALRDAIRVGLDSGPPIAAEEVFAQLRARYAAKA
jgi:antitoxin ParD1/3/4